MAEWNGQAANQVVVFRVGDTYYAVAIEAVREIVEPGPMTVVPGAPETVRGLATVRGSAIPVVDLARQFGAEAGTVATARVVVVLVEGEPVGLLVSDVEEVAMVDRRDLVPFNVPGHDGAAFRGVIQRGEQLVLWADPEELVPRGVTKLAAAV